MSDVAPSPADSKAGESSTQLTAPASQEAVVVARWHVCHTRPRCEKKLAALLKAESIEHYLPLIATQRIYSRQSKRFNKPLFPGYVFACLHNRGGLRIYQQDLLARIIKVEDEVKFLKQMADVRLIVASGLELSLHPLIKKGSTVRVISGPLRGLVGVVDDSKNPKGIVLAVDVLQQGLLVTMSLEYLQPIP